MTSFTIHLAFEHLLTHTCGGSPVLDGSGYGLWVMRGQLQVSFGVNLGFIGQTCIWFYDLARKGTQFIVTTHQILYM